MIPPKRVLYLPIGISYEDIDFNYSGSGCCIVSPSRTLSCIGDDRIACSTCALNSYAKHLHPETYTIEVLK